MAVVAARQGRSSAFPRRTLVRRQGSRLAAVCGSVLALLFGLAVAGTLGLAVTAPASAQGFTTTPH